ncbi:MAG: NAD(P)/FAD-dependent oxidoreductase [Microbacteriaceae bacterium]
MSTTIFERQPPAASVVQHALSATRQSVFWLDDVPNRALHPRLDGTITTQLVVVGGGYSGLWSAVQAKLRDPERTVVLLDAKRIGWAASGRNGGFCDASLTHGEENGLSRWPEEYPELVRLGIENLNGIESTVRDHGLDVQFERTGAIDVAVEPHQLQWVNEHEPAAERLTQEQVRAQVNSPTYLGGIWHRDTTALVHPAKLALELARLAVELGVQIFENSPVAGLHSSHDGVEMQTPHGRVRAQHAVLATNVFPSLLKRNRLMTVPVYDYVLMTQPLSAEQLRSIGWNNRQGLGDMANQFHYYRLSADNRILFGGYDAIYHYGGRIRDSYENRPQSYEALANHFFTTFPQLEGLRFSHRWSGPIDTSTRFCAFFGTARKGRVAYATGFTGLGVAATRFAADTMLDLLDGSVTERTSLQMVRERPLPFPPEPAASLGINATRWSLDRADHNNGKRNVLLKTLDALGLGFDS